MEKWGKISIVVTFRGNKKREVEATADVNIDEKDRSVGSALIKFRKLETGYKRITTQADVNEEYDYVESQLKDYVRKLVEFVEKEIPLP